MTQKVRVDIGIKMILFKFKIVNDCKRYQFIGSTIVEFFNMSL